MYILLILDTIESILCLKLFHYNINNNENMNVIFRLKFLIYIRQII